MDNVLVKAAITDFFIQYSLFLIAICLRTEKFFFLAGSATFFVTIQSLFTGTMFPRQVSWAGLNMPIATSTEDRPGCGDLCIQWLILGWGG